MYCTKCGTNNQDDAKFCKGCGAPLKPSSLGTSDIDHDNDLQIQADEESSALADEKSNPCLPSYIDIPDTYKDMNYKVHYTKLFPFLTTGITVSDSFLKGSFPRSGLLGVFNGLSADTTIAIEKIDGLAIYRRGHLLRTILALFSLLECYNFAQYFYQVYQTAGKTDNLVYSILLYIVCIILIIVIISYNTYCLEISAGGSHAYLEVPGNGLSEIQKIRDDLTVRSRNASNRIVSQQNTMFAVAQNALQKDKIAKDNANMQKQIIDAIENLKKISLISY